MSRSGADVFKARHQEMIALAAEIQQEADYLAYDVNPAGMTYAGWQLMVNVSREQITELENRLRLLREILDSCENAESAESD